MINRSRVGVKLPVTGIGSAEALAVDVGMGVVVEIGVPVGEALGETVGLAEAEGEASKDGSSLA